MFSREHCRLLVTSPNQQCALMCRNDKEDAAHPWDLPYFSIERGFTKSTQESVSHLQEHLGLDPSTPYFTGITDIAGDRTCCEKDKADDTSGIGYARVVLIDTHDYSFRLPDGWEWKGADFLVEQKEREGCRCEIEIAMHRAAMFLRKDDKLVKELRQPRFQMGWFKRASHWLQEVVEKQGAEVIGRVRQFSVCAWTTQLLAESMSGSIYLKAPTAGTPEAKVTQAIHEVLPEMTLDVVAVSEELGCFVSREFRVPGEEERKTPDFMSMMVRKLGEFQLASLPWKETLMEAGCPVLDPRELNVMLDRILEDEDLKQHLPGFMEHAAEFAPMVKLMISRLVSGHYNIPLTVTHGDFCDRNAGFKKNGDDDERMILFDWQYAAISHPFFDFHSVYERNRSLRISFERGDIEEYFDIEPDLIDEYLRMWSEYEPLERCREAFEIAYPLGWLLKCYTTYKCFRAAQHQEFSSMANYLSEFLYRVRDGTENSKCYREEYGRI